MKTVLEEAKEEYLAYKRKDNEKYLKQFKKLLQKVGFKNIEVDRFAFYYDNLKFEPIFNSYGSGVHLRVSYRSDPTQGYVDAEDIYSKRELGEYLVGRNL